MRRTPIEQILYIDRGLTRNLDSGREVAGWPQVAFDSIRGINQITSKGHACPAPVLYEVLGYLKGFAHLTPTALDQLAVALEQSLTAFDVVDYFGDPAVSVERAQAGMAVAATAFRAAGNELEAAQSAIALQALRRSTTRPAAAETGEA